MVRPGVNVNYTREQAFLKRSLAFYRFRRDLTDVNNYYWGAGSALRAVQGRVRHMDEAENFREVLRLTQSEFVKPLGHTPSTYSSQLKVSRRWHGLLTLVLISSAFEIYISAVSTIAIASDPVLRPGFPKRVDGLTFLKHELSAGERNTEALTKGEWPSRLSAFRRTFRSVPHILTENVGELEKLRSS
jgi:hypothetical protein